MNDDLSDVQLPPEGRDHAEEEPNAAPDEVVRLHREYQARLVAANLRTEAVRAGMIDLDGLKLIDFSAAQLGTDDHVIGGRKIIDDLRRSKPWLFAGISSSSAAPVPASQPTRQKSALEMTDEEYAAAKTAVTGHRL